MKTTITSQDILHGFHGSSDIHGLSTRDVEAVLEFAIQEGITDGDDARRAYCASLEDSRNCPHRGCFL